MNKQMNIWCSRRNFQSLINLSKEFQNVPKSNGNVSETPEESWHEVGCQNRRRFFFSSVWAFDWLLGLFCHLSRSAGPLKESQENPKESLYYLETILIGSQLSQKDGWELPGELGWSRKNHWTNTKGSPQDHGEMMARARTDLIRIPKELIGCGMAVYWDLA